MSDYVSDPFPPNPGLDQLTNGPYTAFPKGKRVKGAIMRHHIILSS